MQKPDESLFFFDNGPRFLFLNKRDRIPTEELPEALQEFRLTSGITSPSKSNVSLVNQLLKAKEKNKQNVNFSESNDAIKKRSPRKKRKKVKGEASIEFFLDYDVEDDGKFLYEEAKYSATTILAQLGKLLQKVWERVLFQNDWHKFNASPLTFERDIKGFKWRFEITDKHNRRHFILPEYIVKLVQVEYRDFTRVLHFRPREWQTQAYKDVTDFSSGALKRTDSGIFSVPLTRMSETTCNTSEGDRVDIDGMKNSLTGKFSKDSGMTVGNDGPAIVAYRRESKTPLYYVPKPEVNHQPKISVSKGPRVDNVNVRLGVIRNLKIEEDEELGHLTKFSLTSKDCHEKGWIMNPHSFNEREEKAILEYIRKKLLEAAKKREEEELSTCNTFIYPEVVVHYYGDAKMKALSKFQRKKGLVKRRNRKGDNGVPFMIRLRDGSFTIYYPSGNVAVVNSFVPGYTTSSYIIVYADAEDNNVILAHFTPSGRGVCYHKNGQIAFISTARYAYCHNETGGLINKWKWSGRKLVPSYILQLSSCLTFRCSNKDVMSLFVNIDGESTKIKLAESEVPDEVIQEQQQQLQQQQAKVQKNPRRRKGRLKDIETVEESISKISVCKSNSQMHSYQAELHMLHKKFRDTVKDWMDHYRIAVGMKPPRDMLPKCSGPRSAGSLSRARKGGSHGRNASAPPNFRYCLMEDGTMSKQFSIDGLTSDDSAICLNQQPPFRCGVLQPTGSGLPKKGCPVVHRLQMMGIKDTHCRCDRKKIPIVTDIEFDVLISSLPKSQLIVVSVFQERSSNPFDATLNEIHYQLNKDRSFPCVQSSCDPYRLLRYVIPAEERKESSALLVSRHKVTAGMFIMYLGGKLLFSDYIFDGYGYTKKDFLNQITRTRKEALEDKYLPDDFQFSPKSRSPSPQRISQNISGESIISYNSKSGTTLNEDLDINRNLSSVSYEDTSTKISPRASVRFTDKKAEIKSVS